MKVIQGIAIKLERDYVIIIGEIICELLCNKIVTGDSVSNPERAHGDKFPRL